MGKVADYGNHTKPYIDYVASNNVQGIHGEVHSWDTMIWAAKFKDGKYLPKHWSITAREELPDVEKRFVEDCTKAMKAGRYHDWFFGKRIYDQA